jgi:hypothetical protein
MASDEMVLRGLEESLWRAETRFDRAFMETVLAPDFVEFGRSGRIYDREACLAIPAIPLDAELRDVQLRFLSPDIAQVTYISVVRHETVDVANRSSIWSRTGSGWQLRFHQGTPVEG